MYHLSGALKNKPPKSPLSGGLFKDLNRGLTRIKDKEPHTLIRRKPLSGSGSRPDEAEDPRSREELQGDLSRVRKLRPYNWALLSDKCQHALGSKVRKS